MLVLGFSIRAKIKCSVYYYDNTEYIELFVLLAQALVCTVHPFVSPVRVLEA